MSEPIRMEPLWPRGLTATDAVAGLAGVLSGVPRLNGSLCHGRAPEFDFEVDDEDELARAVRRTRAVLACRRCPALEPCREWLDGLPRRQQPSGVVAGRVVRPVVSRRPKPPAEPEPPPLELAARGPRTLLGHEQPPADEHHREREWRA
jgi:hypothetical protein